MSLFITKYQENHTSIDELKPILENNSLYFPLSVENGFVEEDGFSFGLPVDSGNYSIIKYEMATDSLADETVSMLKKHHDIEKSSAKPLNLDDFIESIDWEDAPAYKQWQTDFPQSEDCDTCKLYDNNNDNSSGNYQGCKNCHHWPHQKQKAYDAIFAISAEDMKKTYEKPFISLSSRQFGPQFLYKIKDGLYIAHMPARRLADLDEKFYCKLSVSEEELLAIISAKCKIIGQNNALHRRISANIKTLSKFFGHQKKPLMLRFDP